MRTMRYVALAEATSFLALLVASYLKRQGEGELGVTILGPIHGALFILYVLVALNLRDRAGWSVKTTLLDPRRRRGAVRRLRRRPMVDEERFARGLVAQRGVRRGAAAVMAPSPRLHPCPRRPSPRSPSNMWNTFGCAGCAPAARLAGSSPELASAVAPAASPPATSSVATAASPRRRRRGAGSGVSTILNSTSSKRSGPTRARWYSCSARRLANVPRSVI